MELPTLGNELRKCDLWGVMAAVLRLVWPVRSCGLGVVSVWYLVGRWNLCAATTAVTVTRNVLSVISGGPRYL